MTLNEIKSEIKSQVTMQELLSFYGFTPIKNKYKCMFHNEKTPSATIKNERLHCFGCGWNGDVISFVQHYENLSYYDAMLFLNAVFNCGVDFGGKTDEFTQLIADVRKYTATLKKIEEQGKTDLMYNDLAEVFNLPANDIEETRIEYKVVFKKLNECKKKLFAKFAREVEEFASTEAEKAVKRMIRSGSNAR